MVWIECASQVQLPHEAFIWGVQRVECVEFMTLMTRCHVHSQTFQGHLFRTQGVDSIVINIAENERTQLCYVSFVHVNDLGYGGTSSELHSGDILVKADARPLGRFEYEAERKNCLYRVMKVRQVCPHS